ncbi:MAG: BatD family protein [Verrucomicrobiae bacterium]|nr:BatD family protein [Verrucomicrobiae bacterium]
MPNSRTGRVHTGRRTLTAGRRAAMPMICAAQLFASALALDGQTFTATLDRNTITLGETATLALTFQGGTPAEIPAPPTVPNLRISYAGQSSQFRFVNGVASSSVSFNYVVTPAQPGEFEIPPIRVTVDGKTLTSNPLKLYVLRPSQPPPESIESGEQIAFLKIVLPKKKVYVGEVIVAELQFYIRAGIQLAAQPELTGFPTDGFTVGKLAAGGQRQAQFGTALYTVLPYYVVLTVVKPGQLSIGPVTANLLINLPSPRAQRDPFLEFFGIRDPFEIFNMERKQVPVAAETETLEALTVPVEHAPPGFNGAVGNYSLTFSVGPTNVAAGDPITVRVQIAGRGALDLLTLPEQPGWRSFKTLAATAKPAETTDPLGIEGVKTFEQVLVPQSTNVTELAPLVFSFFDPDAHVFRTLTSPAVPLVVKPAAASATPMLAGTKVEDNPPAPDIVPIKQRLDTIAAVKPPLIQQPIFWAIQACPVLVWLGLLARRKRLEALATNPRLRRQRQVNQAVRSGLAKLRQLAAQNDADQFFATVSKLLQEQLGERLDLPAPAITETVIDEHLAGRGLPDETLQSLRELFQLCDQARFGRINTAQELPALIPKVESVIDQLRNWKP